MVTGWLTLGLVALGAGALLVWRHDRRGWLLGLGAAALLVLGRRRRAAASTPTTPATTAHIEQAERAAEVRLDDIHSIETPDDLAERMGRQW